MELATAMSEANLSAINDSLVRLSVTLGRIAARQDQMLVDLKKRTAALAPTATTTPTFAPVRVLEQHTTKPSSPSLFSVNQVVGARAPHMGVASATPTGCSTLVSAVNVHCSDVVVAFPTSGTMHLPAFTLTGAGNGMTQGVGGSTLFPELCGYVANEMADEAAPEIMVWNEEIPNDVITRVGGMSLFLELGLNAAEKIFTEGPSKDRVWDKEIADSVLTHIGGMSLFLEQIMDTQHELEEIDKATPWEHGVGGVQVVSPVIPSKEGKLQQILSTEMGNYVSQWTSLLPQGWQDMQMAVKSASSQPSAFIFPQHFESNSTTHRFPWDPGNWLWVLQLITSDQFLSLADLSCLSAHFSISWCDMWVWLYLLLHAPEQSTCFISFPVYMVHLHSGGSCMFAGAIEQWKEAWCCRRIQNIIASIWVLEFPGLLAADFHLETTDSTINEKIMHQLCGITKVWDLGISSLWLGNTRPPDNMQLNRFYLSAKYIQDSLMCLLLAAWTDQYTQTLNFNEIFQEEQAGQIFHGIFSTLVREPKCDITEFCMVGLTIKFLLRALMPVLLNDTYNKFKQAMHGHLQQLECECKNTLPSAVPWHPSCMHYFAIAQPSNNSSCYYDVEMIQSEMYVLLQNSFEILAYSVSTCSFSRWSNSCAIHLEDTAMRPRRTAFKETASGCAEHGIKLGTRSHILGIHECYWWTS